VSVAATDDDPVIALVVAMGEDGGIGKDGDLPWREQRTDLRHFRRVTLGKPVIMGRRTFASLGRVLDQRLNIVLSRDPELIIPGAIVASSLASALESATRAAREVGIGEIAVIGGEDVFRETLPLAKRIHLTEIHAAPPADVFFPPLGREEWREVSRERHEAGPRDEHPFSFVLLERR
jgi:dihydrofolate reductase